MLTDRGVQNAFSKAPVSRQLLSFLASLISYEHLVTRADRQEQREAFLIHLRYSFHNPPLTARDFTAIEHQVSDSEDVAAQPLDVRETDIRSASSTAPSRCSPSRRRSGSG